MNLLNSSEKKSKFFYIFIDNSNLVTKNNLEKAKCIFSSAFFQAITETDKEFANKYLKGVISAYTPQYKKLNNFTEEYTNGTIDYLPFKENYNCNLGLISMFSNRITSEYRTEYNCELSRKSNFPTFPSRMSSCYAFGDYETCLKVSKKYKWDISTVRKFELIPHTYNKVAKVNMEIISLERTANRIASLDAQTQDQIWKLYWSGKETIKINLPTNEGIKEFESGVIWEYLIEGILKLVNK